MLTTIAAAAAATQEEDGELATGIFTCQPAQNGAHRLRDSLRLGDVDATLPELAGLLAALAAEWPASGYHPLQRNCNHFCAAFCAALEPMGAAGGGGGGVGSLRLPRWLNGLREPSARL